MKIFKPEIPENADDSGIWHRVLFFQIIYSLFGLFLGFSCVLGGIVLFIHGIVGSTNWTTNVLGVNSDISDAAPGSILFIVGFFVVLVTRFKITIKQSNDSKSIKTMGNIQLPSKNLKKESHIKKNNLEEAVALAHSLYDSIGFFIEKIQESKHHEQEGKFTLNGKVYTFSYSASGNVTRIINAELNGFTVWVHFEVKDMVMLRKGQGTEGKCGESIYKHIDHSSIQYSNTTGLEYEGDIAEFIDIGSLILKEMFDYIEKHS